MNPIRSYFSKWLSAVALFGHYRNTTIATLVVCAVTLFNRHHSIAPWILPPTQRHLYIPVTFLGYGILLLLVPALSIPLLRPADRFGVRIGHVRTWIVDVTIAYLVLLILIFTFGRGASFLMYYPMYKPAAQAWSQFFAYEGTQLIYMLGWEFIFRGYLLFAARKEIGVIPAIILQMLPFAFLHIGKPEPEVYGSVVAGLFLGLIAVRANSFLPCALLHFAVAFTMDLVATLHRGIIHLPLVKG